MRLRPDDAGFYNNLGLTFQQHNKLDDAVACFQQALRLAPDFAEAHRNLGQAWLLMGQHERGWPKPMALAVSWCQAIPISPAHLGRLTTCGPDHPPPHGQGRGDTIQFIRYAPLVQRRGGRVILGCSEAMRSLLATCAGIDQLVTTVSDSLHFEVHASLIESASDHPNLLWGPYRQGSRTCIPNHQQSMSAGGRK